MHSTVGRGEVVAQEEPGSVSQVGRGEVVAQEEPGSVSHVGREEGTLKSSDRVWEGPRPK